MAAFSKVLISLDAGFPWWCPLPWLGETAAFKEAVQSPLWLSPWPNLGSTIILSNCEDDEMIFLWFLVWELVTKIYKEAAQPVSLLDSAAAKLVSCWYNGLIMQLVPKWNIPAAPITSCFKSSQTLEFESSDRSSDLIPAFIKKKLGNWDPKRLSCFYLTNNLGVKETWDLNAT